MSNVFERAHWQFIENIVEAAGHLARLKNERYGRALMELGMKMIIQIADKVYTEDPPASDMTSAEKRAFALRAFSFALLLSYPEDGSGVRDELADSMAKADLLMLKPEVDA